MPHFDLPLEALQAYRPALDEPADFDSFWQQTLQEAQSAATAPSVVPFDNKLALIDTYDVTFAGFGGSPVRAWLHVPAGASGPLPSVVQYHGYSGGRGFAHSTNVFAAAGYAHWVMDTRGQGWSSGGGIGTADASAAAGHPHVSGFMTAGILDPLQYYYRRVYTDAVRLLETVRSHPLVDPARIAVTGGSQGGGITLAAAGLAPLVGIDLVGAAPDVPFLCHFRRATAITDRDPYAEITRYLAGWRDHENAAYRTLDYFDGVHLGRRATAPALFSVALMDPICPPSTVYAAYNHYGSAVESDVQRQIEVYSHNGHEGGAGYQVQAQLDFFAKIFG